MLISMLYGMQRPSLYSQRREPIEENQIGYEIRIKTKPDPIRSCQIRNPIDRLVDWFHVRLTIRSTASSIFYAKKSIQLSIKSQFSGRSIVRSTTILMRSTAQLVSSSHMLCMSCALYPCFLLLYPLLVQTASDAPLSSVYLMS